MNRVLFNVCGFYPFFLLFFSHLSFGVFGVIQNHPIIPSPYHFSTFFSSHPCNTSFRLCKSPSLHLSSHYCVAVCGRVSTLLYSPPPPPLPFLVKERMRLEREEATRLLEEETEVRHSSSAGLQTTFLSAKGSQKYHRTNSTGLYYVISGKIESSFWGFFIIHLESYSNCLSFTGQSDI